MKQKIVVKVEMNCEKCRSKALQVAASVKGVSEMKIEGKEKDQVMVIGEDVDSVSLTRALKKKVGHAKLVSVIVLDKPAAQVEPESHTQVVAIDDGHPYPYSYSYPYYRWNPSPQLYYVYE